MEKRKIRGTEKEKRRRTGETEEGEQVQRPFASRKQEGERREKPWAHAQESQVEKAF